MHRNFCFKKWQLFKFLIVYKTHKIEMTPLYFVTADQTIVFKLTITSDVSMCNALSGWKDGKETTFKGPFKAYSDRASAFTFALTLALVLKRNILVSIASFIRSVSISINTTVKIHMGSGQIQRRQHWRPIYTETQRNEGENENEQGLDVYRHSS